MANSADRKEYKRALDNAQREFEKLLVEKSTLETRVAQLRQTVISLRMLLGLSITDDEWLRRNLIIIASFSDACREVFYAAGGEELTAVDVREALRRSGYDLSVHKNALASIHTVLKRFVGRGELETRLNEQRKRVYYTGKEKVGEK